MIKLPELLIVIESEESTSKDLIEKKNPPAEFVKESVQTTTPPLLRQA